jgi:predicted nucleotidyltransferase
MMQTRDRRKITRKEITDLLSPLFADRGLRLAVLFGSVASGKAHGKSDVDIGFLFDGPVDIVALTNEVSRLLRRDEVDVVDLGPASPLLKFHAAKGGVVLYEREPGLFMQFYSLSYRMYVDAKKLRDARDRSIERFLQSGGRS